MTLKKKLIQIFNQPESLFILVTFLGLIITSLTISSLTLLFFDKNFSGRNLYFQVLFFVFFNVFFSIILLVIFSKIKKHLFFQNLFSKYDIFYCRNKIWLLWLLFLLITALFIILKMSIFKMDNLRIWKDTTEYVTLSTHPFFSKEFWFGNRTLVLPLFYKILNITLENYRSFDPLYRIAITQFWIGIFTWVALSAIIGKYFVNRFFRIASWILIYLLALGLPNSQWEKLILSESLSNSFFVLLIVLFLLNSLIYKMEKLWIRIVYLLVIFITSLLYAFTRDTNGYLLFFAGCVILLFWFIKKKNPQFQNLILIGISFILSFAFAFVDSSLSTRWAIPLVHVLEDRKNEHPILAQYFYSKGIDLFEYFPDPKEVTSTSISETTELNSKNIEFMAKTKLIYTKFLVSHPGYSFLAPLNDINEIISPYITDGRYNVNGTPDWVYKLSNSIYPPRS